MNDHSLFSKAQNPWLPRQEASRNWLALGLLLAAWNSVAKVDQQGSARRPHALRAYPFVSVRSAVRASACATSGAVHETQPDGP